MCSRFPIERDGPPCEYNDHPSSETTNCHDCGCVVCPEHRQECEQCKRIHCWRCARKYSLVNGLCERCEETQEIVEVAA
jgi:hypothetical protein